MVDLQIAGALRRVGLGSAPGLRLRDSTAVGWAFDLHSGNEAINEREHVRRRTLRNDVAILIAYELLDTNCDPSILQLDDLLRVNRAGELRPPLRPIADHR